MPGSHYTLVFLCRLTHMKFPNHLYITWSKNPFSVYMPLKLFPLTRISLSMHEWTSLITCLFCLNDEQHSIIDYQGHEFIWRQQTSLKESSLRSSIILNYFFVHVGFQRAYCLILHKWKSLQIVRDQRGFRSAALSTRKWKAWKARARTLCSGINSSLSSLEKTLTVHHGINAKIIVVQCHFCSFSFYL